MPKLRAHNQNERRFIQEKHTPFAWASFAKTAVNFLGLTKKSPGIHIPPCNDNSQICICIWSGKHTDRNNTPSPFWYCWRHLPTDKSVWERGLGQCLCTSRRMGTEIKWQNQSPIVVPAEIKIQNSLLAVAHVCCPWKSEVKQCVFVNSKQWK